MARGCAHGHDCLHTCSARQGLPVHTSCACVGLVCGPEAVLELLVAAAPPHLTPTLACSSCLEGMQRPATSTSSHYCVFMRVVTHPQVWHGRGGVRGCEAALLQSGAQRVCQPHTTALRLGRDTQRSIDAQIASMHHHAVCRSHCGEAPFESECL